MSLPMQHDLAGTVSELTISFGSRTVINNANMCFYKNHIHVLTGASGSGKTTFLRALNRLNDQFDQCRTQGEITLSLNGVDQDIHALSRHQLPKLRKSVGMVFQHPQLLPGSIAENLLLPLKVVSGMKMNRGQAQQAMENALKQAALWDEVNLRLNAPATSLSGGQQQRLCLARTLALEPEILLLDEPTASLDSETAAQIEELIRQLSQRYTIVMVSHSAKQTQKLADHISHFEQGAIV